MQSAVILFRFQYGQKKGIKIMKILTTWNPFQELNEVQNQTISLAPILAAAIYRGPRDGVDR
jgi:hypothetical protein